MVIFAAAMCDKDMKNIACMALCLALWCVAAGVKAQTLAPTAVFCYTGSDGAVVEEEAESFSGSAPVTGRFCANPTDADGYDVRYEWRITRVGDSSPLVLRFDEDLEYTFTSSGSFSVEVLATFVVGTDTISYPDEGETGQVFTVSIATSRLEMPNGFSPNGDSFNEVYKAKDNHQSIVSFHAVVFNRWGKRLYEWHDVNGGWDGRVGGRMVPDGVYFVNVVAKGADGHDYHIRKDINVLTGYTEAASGASDQ